MLRSLLLISFTVIFSSTGFSQRTCGTVENYNQMILKNPVLREQIENEVKAITDRNELTKRRTQVVVAIPVVVHVIHNNEAIGTGTNISDAQIQSQIQAMTKDFRLLNPDSLQPSHPFWQFTCDVLIEFCLARQTPGGQPSTGIERLNRGLDWSMSDCNNILKPQTIWDPHRYLNLWTVDWEPGSPDLLGYAQFPGGPDETDGVVIGYTNFGTTGNVLAPYNLGRTVTHEVGHWFGLQHIWGDAFCGDDLISDTPPQVSDNVNCPTFPRRPFNSCGSNANGEMYMNYMDYVDDRCMVMFTYEQAVRMNSTLYGSRASLITSNGCSTPNPGIAENEIFGQKISLYSNPTSGHIKIRVAENSSESLNIILTDVLGRSIKHFTIDNAQEFMDLDLSEFSSGFYFLQFHQKGLSTIKKINLIK
ncbi:MAG: T9SS type A sorting domain-containing protein [Bacteroidia bacterium]|nr:T9SS type A sorting domain-containing protein [Bacteroidia bacterium]